MRDRSDGVGGVVPTVLTGGRAREVSTIAVLEPNERVVALAHYQHGGAGGDELPNHLVKASSEVQVVGLWVVGRRATRWSDRFQPRELARAGSHLAGSRSFAGSRRE